MTKAANCWEHVQQDKTYKKLSDQIAEQHRLKRSLDDQLRDLLWDVQGILRAVDACRSFLYRELEDEKSDKDLEAITSEDSDCWSSNWGRSADTCRDAAVTLCQRVAELQPARERVSEQLKKLTEEQNALAVKLRREWHDNQEAVKASN
jgi:uncharacterized coiled-coil protein SlyX